MRLLLVRRYRTQVEAGVFAETVVRLSGWRIGQGCVWTSGFR